MKPTLLGNVIQLGIPIQFTHLLEPNIHDIQRAKIKAKLLTGTDILQANRSRFKVDPTCGLCLTHPETREHFISHCISLSDSRRCFITKADVLQVKPEVLTTLEPVQFTQPCF